MNPRFKLILSVFVFFCAIFMLTNSGPIGFSEGEYNYSVAEQIIGQGQVGFDTPPWDGGFVVAPNGKFYNAHEIGNALFMLPVAFFNISLENILSDYVNYITIVKLKKIILMFEPSIFCAVTATTFFSILVLKFHKRVLSAFIASLFLVFTTFFWGYSRSLYDGTLCTTLLIVSFLNLLEYKQKMRMGYLIFSFICLGLGFITRFPMILAIIASVMYVFILTYNQDRSKVYTAISLILLPFFAWQAFYNHLRSGYFYMPGVLMEKFAGQNLPEKFDLLEFPTRVAGLLISPGKGFFVYAPLLILSLAFFRKFSKDFKKEAMYIVVLTILWLLLHASLGSNWYGKTGWGPRHLITILPIAFIPFAVNVEIAFSYFFSRLITIVLATFGFILSISSIISNFQFRVSYAESYNISEDDFIWGFWHSQSIDIITSAIENIYRIFSNSPIVKLPNMPSEANEYASSTINVWANSLGYAGVPWYIVVLLILPLIFAIYKSLFVILEYAEDKSV